MESKKTLHTPTPWTRMGTIIFCPEPGPYIGQTRALVGKNDNECFQNEETAKANAAHIVKCVNAHDGLIAAIKNAVEWEKKNPLLPDEVMHPLLNALKAAGEEV